MDIYNMVYQGNSLTPPYVDCEKPDTRINYYGRSFRNVAIRSRNPHLHTQRCGRIRELQGVGRSWMNHACVHGMRHAGFTQPLLSLIYRTVGATKQLSPSPSKQKGIFLFSFSSLDIGALDATISARRRREFPFPVNGNGRSDIHVTKHFAKLFLFSF